MPRYRQSRLRARSLIISGGVACNAGLREAARTAGLPYPVFFPAPGLSTDNAAMIAAAAFPKLERRDFADFSLKAQANLAWHSRSSTIEVMATQPTPPACSETAIPGVRSLIAIGSGKGGVGKTTVSVNLAIALAKFGRKVGLLDADVYGPNVPLMMGVRATPQAIGERIQPIESKGVRIMSMGFLNPGDKPLIWRGPMLHSVIQQFLRNVDWGELDYLLIDLPPGTGDVALSLIQTAPLSGAVVVTTPSDVSLEDARKAVNMFAQVRVPILGMIENMSYLKCPHCGEQIDVFSTGGGRRTAKEMDVFFLGGLPLDPEVRVGGDSGHPVALAGENNPHARDFMALARELENRVELARAERKPTMAVED